MLLADTESEESREENNYNFTINLCNNFRDMETSSFDLVYLESDPRTKQPSACVCTRTSGGPGFAGVKADRLVTAPCLTFIELDAEIRRLHAELDEIRARAKKKFYRAFGSAAGA